MIEASNRGCVKVDLLKLKGKQLQKCGNMFELESDVNDSIWQSLFLNATTVLGVVLSFHIGTVPIILHYI